MSYAEDWGPPVWLDSTGTTPQATGAPTDVFQQTTGGTTTDQWSGFWQGLIGNVTSYAIAKDAAKNGLQPARAANGQPVYQPGAPVYTQAPTGISGGALLLIGGVVVVGALAYAASKG